MVNLIGLWRRRSARLHQRWGANFSTPASMSGPPCSPPSRRLRTTPGRATGSNRSSASHPTSTLTARFGLPEEASFLIFAVAPSIGSVAHAVEQVGQGGLIRPEPVTTVRFQLEDYAGLACSIEVLTAGSVSLSTPVISLFAILTGDLTQPEHHHPFGWDTTRRPRRPFRRCARRTRGQQQTVACVGCALASWIA